MNQELLSFVKESLAKQIPRSKITAALKDAGWDEAERKEALESFADTDFPVAVPRRKPYVPAREAFLYLLMFATLYMSAFHFGSLLFDLVNKYVPDPLSYAEYSNVAEAARFSVASLIVAFPVFMWISRLLRREIRKRPEHRGSKVRKWLTYITLFISAGIIIGDLIAILHQLLSGDPQLRFFLKAFIVLLVAAAIFGFYLWDLRQDDEEFVSSKNEKRVKLYGNVAMVSAMIVSVIGIFLAGSPLVVRGKEFDMRRVNDLQSIAYGVDTFYTSERRVPTSLDELATFRNIYVSSTHDPETGMLYDYRVLEEGTKPRVEICATFAQPSIQQEQALPKPVGGSADRYWDHGAGLKCYQIDVDTSRLKSLQ